MKKWFALITAVLLLGVLYQVTNLSVTYGQNLIAIRNNLGKSGSWRGANFNQSQKVADYIEFLQQNIPANARVILPSFGGDSKVLVNPYMQFFLAPREVLNCLNIECLQTISREDTYIVILGNLPKDLFSDTPYIMFDEHWGLLPPDDYTSENISEMVSFTSLGAIILAGVGPLLWIAALILSGSTVAILLYPGQERLLTIAFGYGLGFSLFSIGIILVNLVGFNLNTLLIIVMTMIIMVLPCSILFWRNRKLESENPQPGSGPKKIKFDFWTIIFIGLSGIATIFAVGKGYHRIDAIQIWGAKAYGIAADGTFAGVTNWGTNTLAYPLHIPGLIAAFRVLFGDLLPSSKLIFCGYYLATMMVGYFTLLGMGVRRWLSGLAVVLLFTTPIIFQHGTIGYANLPLTFYLLCGVVVFLPVFAGRITLGNLLLSGLFFASAAWTRPEGLILSIICAGLLLFLVHFDKNHSFCWRKALIFLAPLLVYLVFWQVIKQQMYPDPLTKSNLASDALLQIIRGDFHIRELFFIIKFLLQEMVSPNVWGALGVILLFAAFPVLFFRKSVSRAAKVMIATGGLFLAMIIGMYYLTSFDSAQDLSWWVTTGLNRMIFPGLVLLWLGIIGAYQDLSKVTR